MLVASFSTSVDGLTVTLADTSTPPQNGTIIDVEVAWGDGHTDGVQPKRSVSHTYPSAGTYSILETVTDSTLHVARATGTVTVSAPPPPPPPPPPLVASFTTSVDGATVSLSDTTVPPTSGSIIDVEVSWGDGKTDGVAPGRTVSHAYPSSGTYSILETVTDSFLRVARATRSVTVVVPPPPPPPPPLVASFSTSVDGLTVSLSDTTAAPTNGKIIDVEVAWGDGGTNGVQPGRTVGHTYLGAGTYTIVETVTDSTLRVAQRSATVTVAPIVPPPPPPQWARRAFQFQAQGVYRDRTGSGGKQTKILKVKKKLGFPKRDLLHRHFVIEKTVYTATGLTSGGVAVPVTLADELVDGIALDIPVAIGIGDELTTTLTEVQHVDCISPNLRIDAISIVPVVVPGSDFGHRPDQRLYHLAVKITADIPWDQIFVFAEFDSATLAVPYSWECTSPPDAIPPSFACNPAWGPVIATEFMSFAATVKGRFKLGAATIAKHTLSVSVDGVFPEKIGGVWVCPSVEHFQSRSIFDGFAIFDPEPPPNR